MGISAEFNEPILLWEDARGNDKKRKREEVFGDDAEEQNGHGPGKFFNLAKKLKTKEERKVEKAAKKQKKKLRMQTEKEKQKEGKRERSESNKKSTSSSSTAAKPQDKDQNKKRSKEEKKKREKEGKRQGKDNDSESGEGKGKKDWSEINKLKQNDKQWEPAAELLSNIPKPSPADESTTSMGAAKPINSDPTSLDEHSASIAAKVSTNDINSSHACISGPLVSTTKVHPAIGSPASSSQLQPSSHSNQAPAPILKRHTKMSTPTVAARSPNSLSTLTSLPKSSLLRDPSKPKKSVQFTPDTKPTDGNSREVIHRAILGNYPSAAIVTPEQFSSSLSSPLSRKEQRKSSRQNNTSSFPSDLGSPSETPLLHLNKKKKKKKKKQQKQSSLNPDQANQKIKEEAIQYLHLFHTDKSSWRFRKSKQNWILRNLFEFGDANNAGTASNIPSTPENNASLKAYIASIQGTGTRDRLLAEAKSFISGFGTKKENQRDNGIRKEVEGDACMGNVTGTERKDMVIERAKLVLAALGHGEDYDSEDGNKGINGEKQDEKGTNKKGKKKSEQEAQRKSNEEGKGHYHGDDDSDGEDYGNSDNGDSDDSDGSG